MRVKRTSLGRLAFLSVASFPIAAAAQMAPPPPMQSGGLSPPPKNTAPPPPPPPAYGPTQLALEQAQEKDSGRGLEFVYLDGEAGFEFAALEAITKSGNLLPEGSNSSAVGLMFGAAAGLRLLYFTVGPHFRFAHTNDWDLWTLNLDFGWRIPLGMIEPHGEIGGGYAKLGHSADKLVGLYPDVSVSGFDFRLGAGVDYYPTNAFSIGATLDFEFLRLARSRVSPLRADAVSTTDFTADASSLGLTVTGGIVVGLHF
jgi:opacity protein-like surface antigen